MNLGKYKIFNILFFFLFIYPALSADKIDTVPLINLEELSPTFEEEDSELEKLDNSTTKIKEEDSLLSETDINEKNKIYINIKALDKVTAKTSSIKILIGEKKSFGPLEIKALKCERSENTETLDTVAYLQVKDLSIKDNNQVFLFNGWTFASSPTLQSIDHPVYDLWVIDCDNI